MIIGLSCLSVGAVNRGLEPVRIFLGHRSEVPPPVGTGERRRCEVVPLLLGGDRERHDTYRRVLGPVETLLFVRSCISRSGWYRSTSKCLDGFGERAR